MSLSLSYGSYPKVTLVWSTSNVSYLSVQYYGNAIVGTGGPNSQISSGIQAGTSWTSNDLSFSALYTFTITPYNSDANPGPTKQVTVNTTPRINAAYASATTTSSTQIQWYGTYYYVRIFRKTTTPYVTGYIEVSANAYYYTPPFHDVDLSGNTTYLYYIQPYDANNNLYTTSTTITVYTTPHAATDLSSIFYDVSSIQISFKLPNKNSYVSSSYYQLSAVSNGVVKTSAIGTSSPLMITDLSSGTTYDCYILTYLDGVLGSTSNVYTLKTTSTYKTNGLYFIIKKTYFADNIPLVDTLSNWNAPYDGYTYDLTNISTGTNGRIGVNGADHYTVMWYGKFYTGPYSGNFTFYTYSDDSSLLWLGPVADSGYSLSNLTVDNRGLHGMGEVSNYTNKPNNHITLSAYTYYSIRILFGEYDGGDDCRVSFTLPGQSNRIYNGLGYYFS